MPERSLLEPLPASEMELFWSTPRSFKMDRRSPQASFLKAAISSKLRDFLGNYSDDVLAEYIVVLVCNGKHQTQARDDLEAFLGSESAKFVAWIWQLLSEEIYNSKEYPESSFHAADMNCDGDDVANTEIRPNNVVDIQRQTQQAETLDAPPTMDKNNESLNLPVNLDRLNSVAVSESLLHPDTRIDAFSTEVIDNRYQGQECAVQKGYGSVDANRYEIPKYQPSVAMHSQKLECLAGGEQHLGYEGLESHFQKIHKDYSSQSPSQSILLTEKGRVARNIQSVISDDTQYRPLLVQSTAIGRLPSVAGDAAQNRITRERRNVWDRLGKPCEEEDGLPRRKKPDNAHDGINWKNLDQIGEKKPRWMRVVPGAKLRTSLMEESAILESSRAKIVSNDFCGEYKLLERNIQAVGTLDSADIPTSKRQFGEIDYKDYAAPNIGSEENLLHIRKPTQKLQKTLSTNSRYSQSLNEVTNADNSTSKMVSGHSKERLKMEPGSQTTGISQPQSSRKASVSTAKYIASYSSSMPLKSESPAKRVGENANPGLANNEILDVKLRLRQIEMDMLKLRSKQSGLNTERKLSTPSGPPNQSEEDMEARTVLVNNVHFAATREAIFSHFSKCGVIVKVIILTEPITAQPKGVVYIVFANKESVDKAVLMTGTSFFSRILTVMRKADMPPGFLSTSPLPAKLAQSWHPQTDKKASFQRNFSGNHLQWRRDQGQPAGGENTLPATTSP